MIVSWMHFISFHDLNKLTREATPEASEVLPADVTQVSQHGWLEDFDGSHGSFDEKQSIRAYQTYAYGI